MDITIMDKILRGLPFDWTDLPRDLQGRCSKRGAVIQLESGRWTEVGDYWMQLLKIDTDPDTTYHWLLVRRKVEDKFEWLRNFLTKLLKQADMVREGTEILNTGWMLGVTYMKRSELPIVLVGHVTPDLDRTS